MKKNTALLNVVGMLLLAGTAEATSSPEDTGLSLAGGYSQAKLSGSGVGTTPSGTDFAVRATYAQQGAFVKAEYERSDMGERILGTKLNFSIEETRIGLGYAFPIAPTVKIYPAADYVINRQRVEGGGAVAHGADHGYFVGGGGTVQFALATVYGRTGYYHISGYGESTKGPDALLGVGVDLSPEASVFAETRYTPLSGGRRLRL